jgi:hypothetical protein
MMRLPPRSRAFTHTSALVLLVLSLVALGGGLGEAPSSAQPQVQPAALPEPRFETIDINIDSGATPLAAYQLEIRATGDARLVGIEGGAHSAFAEPPFYNPRALPEGQLNQRIIIAAFSTDQALPRGNTRVARLHLQVRGEAQYTLHVQAAGAEDGRRIDVVATHAPAQ